MKFSEKEIQDSIISYLKAAGLYVQRINSGLATNFYTGNFMAQAEKGHSDLITCRPDNRIAFIEVKTSSGKLSDPQIFFLRAQEAAGRAWLIATCLDDLIRWLADENYHGSPKFVKYVMDSSTKFVLKPRQDKRLRASDVLAHELWAKRGEVVDKVAQAVADAENPLL
jgi:hypothetical protein